MASQDLIPLLERLDRIAKALEGRSGVTSHRPSAPPPGRAFRWSERWGFLPVRRPGFVPQNLLTGIDRQRTALVDDVARFLRSAPCHDVLLWGERGTGKSTLVRSLLGAFPARELAVVEVGEPDIPAMPALLDAIDGDPRRWLLFLDDLSFQGPGDHYRELKVLLDGGLEERPANALVIATSNRRHLVPEAHDPRDEIHPEEAVAEAMSLSDRFGLSLGFYAFDEETYLAAVESHLRAFGVEAIDRAWRTVAVQWAMSRGIRCGRTALQAAKEIAGRAE